MYKSKALFAKLKMLKTINAECIMLQAKRCFCVWSGGGGSQLNYNPPQVCGQLGFYVVILLPKSSSKCYKQKFQTILC